MSVQLYLGDCLDILPTLEAGSVDAVITDPPYGIDFDYGNGYDDAPGQYTDFMHSWLALTMTDGRPHFVWQALPNLPRFNEWFPDGYRVMAMCKGFVQYRPTPIQWSWDPVVFWGDIPCAASVYRKDWFVQRKAPFGAKRKKVDHPCPRPLESVIYAVEMGSLPGQTILDPFMGSGTTGVACVKTGRNFIGIEIDPDYYAIAEKRIAEAQQQLRLGI